MSSSSRSSEPNAPMRSDERRLEPRVDPAAASGDDEAPALQQRDRTFGEDAPVDQIELHEAVVLAVLVRRAYADVDDAAHHPSVARAEIAWIKIDLLEQLGRDDRRQTAEMVDEGHEHAVDEGLRVLRSRAAHDEQTRESGRPAD